MKKIFLTVIAAMLFTSAAYTQGAASEEKKTEDTSLGLTLALDYWSNYIWRGTYWFSGDGAFFPFVSYNLLKSGLTLNVGGEISEEWLLDGEDASGSTLANQHSIDLGLVYSKTFNEAVTVGASVWYYHIKGKINRFGSAAVSASYVSVLNPTITYTHDYIVETKKKNDYYLQFGIGNGYEMTKEVKLAYSIAAGYYNVDSAGLKGISDVTCTFKPTISLGSASIYSAMNVIYVPSEDFYKNGSVDDKLRFFAVFGSSFTF